MKWGKILLVIIVVSLLTGLFSAAVGVSEGLGKSGDTGASSVIWIYNVYDLQNMSKNLSGHYALANDINASVTHTWNNGSGFIPVGNGSKSFTGSFDGRGHKIINLYIDLPSTNDVGLFGYTLNPAIIENVSLVNVNIYGRHNVGGLIGYSEYTLKVSNCYVSGTVRGSEDNIGGLIGYSFYSSTVSNISVFGNISGIAEVGGIMGYTYYSSTIGSSCVFGNVSGSGTYIGGLVGDNDHTPISNCYMMGNVSGNGEVGGLVGESDETTISNSYMLGNVSGSDRFIGGLAGDNDGRISASYAIGNVSGDSYIGGLVGGGGGSVSDSYAMANVIGNKYIGGLIGDSGGTVSNCYAMANVSGSSYTGGLVGSNWGTVKYSYATGNVNGTTNVGGLIGYNDSDTVTASFWDVNTSGQNGSAGGTGKTTAEMKNKTTFISAGWDFNNTWSIIDGVTYPFFIWQEKAPSAPLNIRVKSGDGWVNLTWIPPNDDGYSAITEYRIYRGNASGNEIFLINVSSANLYYNDTSVMDGITYYYYVTAVNSVGESTQSSEVNVTPQAGVTAPAPPQSVHIDGGMDYIKLTWNAPSNNGGANVTEYKVYRSTESGREILISAVPASQLWYNDTSVRAETTYYYYVTAVNAAGESDNSTEVNATVPYVVPEFSTRQVMLLVPLVLIFAFWRKRR